jgi:hypothetical protein
MLDEEDQREAISGHSLMAELMGSDEGEAGSSEEADWQDGEDETIKYGIELRLVTYACEHPAKTTVICTVAAVLLLILNIPFEF